MRRTAWLLVLLAGCGRPPEVEETLVVYSLQPLFGERGEIHEPQADGQRFGEWTVLGSAAVNDPATRERLLAAVRDGIDGAKGQPPTACLFNPRHGLHHVAKDGTVTDTVICFECGDVRVQTNGERPGKFGQTTRTPQNLLNDTLRTAGVKLADGAEGK